MKHLRVSLKMSPRKRKSTCFCVPFALFRRNKSSGESCEPVEPVVVETQTQLQSSRDELQVDESLDDVSKSDELVSEDVTVSEAALHEKPKTIVLGGPDFEEGPDCAIGEEEFFDAIDAQLDKMESDNEMQNALRSASLPDQDLAPDHPLFDEISRICGQHLASADLSSNHPGPLWELIDEEGDMKVYTREQEEDGLTVDPLLAVHSVRGFSAKEFCNVFWDLQYRLDWEHTLDAPPVLLEAISADTVVLHQLYKRIWPATQREAVFWSRILHAGDVTMVVNYSTDYAAPPINRNKTVRLRINVAMICQTMYDRNIPVEKLTREDVTCKIRYSAFINPGGWAPASAVRAVSRKEGPKFCRRFTQFVEQITKDKPLQL